MERKIGEIFEYNGEWYQCIRDITCINCGFNNKGCLADKHITGDCSGRLDGASVVFKKLEKVGEPFTGKVHIQLQRYKMYTNPIINSTENVSYIDEGNTIAIELKQNQEDMEEKKLNLKPFDIQKAREGKPVCTRDGRKARIICFDTKGDPCPIIALVEENNIESAYHYDKNGQNAYKKSEIDLMMLPEKKEGWVNVYNADTTFYFVEGMVYDTKEEAIKHINPDNEIYITTVKVQWEE